MEKQRTPPAAVIMVDMHDCIVRSLKNYQNALDFLRFADKKGVPIVLVRMEILGPLDEGIMEAAGKNARTFSKRTLNAFSEFESEKLFPANAPQHLLIGGFNRCACAIETIRGALLEKKYSVATSEEILLVNDYYPDNDWMVKKDSDATEFFREKTVFFEKLEGLKNYLESLLKPENA